MIVLAYLAAIVAANLSIAAFGPSASIINAFLFIGLDLTARDRLHEEWQTGRAWKMALLIAAGGALSYVLNRDAAQIAIASSVAFTAAALTDWLMYSALGDRARLVRVNGSNVVSAAVDSAIFPAIAFGFPLLWTVMLGQWLAKVAGGALWSLVLTRKDKSLVNSLNV